MLRCYAQVNISPLGAVLFMDCEKFTIIRNTTNTYMAEIQ